MVISGHETAEESTDRRLQRGARSRRAVTRRAVEIASLDGLDGLSFGRLAEDLGVSKAGIQTLFRTKETLQLATVEAAQEAFVDAVVRPARDCAAGVARIRALVDGWIDYAARPLFPGGCFWGANLPIFDSRPGPVRDALRQQQRDWVAILATQFRLAAAAREIAPLNPEEAAFQVAAVLNAVNLALRLGDDDSVSMARHVVNGLLGAGTDSGIPPRTHRAGPRG
ncbi:TetR/AcrR family transcriptional regulator [Nocardia sp. NEAU-G5]|uniref:TetR/AcrR family transcriptional regulator n=1 Tax=Nocardia albiluteola TaxID=2842303 RepID=A0ABS6B3K7_9NOCA|nr:TetR/AcrR family transcriptional regulator [Nocardia albiluteola]MBU3064887.1 TetR/AcrR family transcriptional regulator [Nocardia albiluteola]